MSWERERNLDPGNPAGRSSPLMLVGLVVGLLAMSPALVLYYWLFAPVAPLAVGGVLVLVAAKKNQLFPVAEGCFAAALFGLTFVVLGLLTLGNFVQ